jgi:cytidine deaminase
VSRALSRAELEDAVARAFAVRERAHAPYSGFRVGAVLVMPDGSMHAGCNVEIASYGGTVCAERNAVAAMIASGARGPLACVIATQDARPTMPCGICRQALFEVADDLQVLTVAELPSGVRAEQATTLAELLPFGFKFDPVTKGQPAR